MGGITKKMTASPGRISWEKAACMAVALMCLFFQDAIAATPWPTTQFKVDFSEKNDSTSTGQEESPEIQEPGRKPFLDPSSGEDTPETRRHRIESHAVLASYFEQSLHEAAEALKAEGFEPPSLPVFVDGTEKYFKVNVFDFSKSDDEEDDSAGVYHSGTNCDDTGVSETAWFAINSTSFVPLTPSREAYLYVVLAHELVHAIQARYPATSEALNGCSGNTEDEDTAREGTADAVAYMLATKRWPKYYLKFGYEMPYPGGLVLRRYTGEGGLIDPDLLGWRSYQTPFLDYSADEEGDAQTAAYNTSSFWFNLIDRYGIRFIDHLYRQPLKYGDSPSLLQWLDHALESHKPRLGSLYTIFPHFVTEFASQAGSRLPYDEFAGFGNEVLLVSRNDPTGQLAPYVDAQKWWIRRILGDCTPIKLVTNGNETSDIDLELDPVSAVCVEISWEGFEGNFELVIEAESSNLRLVDQLQIGLVYEETEERERYCYSEVHPHYREPLWTCMHEKPFVKSGPQNLRYIKNWTESGIGFTGSGRRIITVSNVAKDAEKTRPISKSDQVKLRVGIVEAKGADGRQYDPPNSVTIGSPGMITMSPENLYGITKSPAPAGMRLSVSVAVKGDDLGYAAVWMAEPPSLGYKGPYKGVMSGPTGGSRVIMSSLCARHSDGVIGQITRFDRDHLWIDFDADLCEMTIPPRLDGRYPKVDHFKASLRFPFGWRYSAENSPVDIVTPGMQIFIDRHAKRLPMVLSGTWNNPDPTANPGTATTTSGPGSANPGGPPGAAPGSSGSSSGGALDSCTCSCEELTDFDNRAGEAKKAGDNDATMALAGQMMACVGQCQREYMICRMDAGEAEKQKKELVRKQEAEARQAKCDCSCEALDDIVSGGQEFEKQLQKQFAEGGSLSNENILQLTQCYSACQQEAIACAMKK
jgi:hypothetical protein